MGLDVYLYKCKNLKALNEFENRQSQAHDDAYTSVKTELGLKKEDQMTTDQYKLVRKRQAAWDEANPPPEDAVETEVKEKDSKTYPKHYFKVGYLRSSYNDGGINSILRAAIGKDLYTIFKDEAAKDEYKFVPDWQASLERARQIRGEYAAYVANEDDSINASPDANGKNWYLAALDITIEMIEFVLSKKDPEHYCLHWSS